MNKNILGMIEDFNTASERYSFNSRDASRSYAMNVRASGIPENLFINIATKFKVRLLNSNDSIQ